MADTVFIHSIIASFFFRHQNYQSFNSHMPFYRLINYTFFFAHDHETYRAVNYIRDENGNPICPNGRKFLFKRKQHVRYKKYGRTEEIYPSLLSVPFLHKTVTIFKKHILM